MKPEVKLIGTGGNVFSIIGTVSRGLKNAGLREQAKEFAEKAFLCSNYDEVLQLVMEYVDVR